MPRKPSRKTLKTKLDKAWSIAVKKRAGNVCEVCKSSKSLNAHHIVGRRNLRLRWELYNGVCLCAKHHVFGMNSAHQNSEWFHFWLEEHRWEDLAKVNVEMVKGIKKWTMDELQDKLKELEGN